MVDAALELVEIEGGAALTMRRLASELDVTTTTIYWHVGNRDELVVALIGRLAERMGASEIAGATALERVTCAATNIWDSALAHRNVTALANQVGATTLLHLPLEVALLAELEAAGLRGAVARDAMGSILYCIAGFLVGVWRDEERVPRELRRAALWGSVDDDRLAPATVRAMQSRSDPRTFFESTLEAVITALLVDPSGRTREGHS